MSAQNPERPTLRNVGIAAHIDAGKTTLTERFLLYTGAIRQAGNVDEGNTTTDYDPIERRKGITIFAAAVSCHWTPTERGGARPLFAAQRHQLNIIDTPGHVDFTAEVERSLRVLDGLVAVFCAVAGVQPQSETVWRQATRHRVPRIAFINKMDRVGANFARVVQELRDKLAANAWPVLLPWGVEDGFQGQLDVIHERAYRFSGASGADYTIEELPDDVRAIVKSARADLVTAVAEIDDDIAALWINQEPVSSTALQAGIRRATMANRFVPVIPGSAFRCIGAQPLLDAVVDYLPSPIDVGAVPVHRKDGTTGTIEPKVDDAAAALSFKIARDEQGRRLVFLRVYAGELRKGDRVVNVRTEKPERIGRLLRVFANRREDLEVASAGDIVAAVGLKDVGTGDTICAPGRVLQFEPPVFPEPVVNMALEPRTQAERERLINALVMLSDEDPTFRTFTDPETGQSIIAGMGELHLEIIRERLINEHGVQTLAGPPAIAYRETITAGAEADHLFRKQHGGVGLYARVQLAVRPNEAGRGLSIESLVTGGSIPPQFIKAVRQGIADGLGEGALGGYPMVDVHVDILGGAAHARDSNELAFQVAGTAAIREALAKAKPVLLEPIMMVDVETPSEAQGDLVGDLQRRRGTVVSVDAGPVSVMIRGEVPLAELWGYAVALRSLSRGRASFTMTPSHFAPVPESIARQVVGGG